MNATLMFKFENGLKKNYIAVLLITGFISCLAKRRRSLFSLEVAGDTNTSVNFRTK